MQQITNITLYADRPNNVTVYAKQDDADTRVVVATLFDGSSPLDTSDVETGSVKIRRPSGTGCMLDVDDIDGNVITFTLKGQALTVPGEAEGEICLMTTSGMDEAAARLTSFKFRIIIEASVVPDSQIENSDDYTDFLDKIGDAVRSVTFIPSVDSEGVISWENDGGLQNPESVNIKGPQGDTGTTGPQGPQGVQGAQGPQGDPGIFSSVGLTHSTNNLHVMRTGKLQIWKYNGTSFGIMNQSDAGDNTISLLVLILTQSSVSVTFYQSDVHAWSVLPKTNSETISGAGTYIIYAEYTTTSSPKQMKYEVIKL